VSPRQNPSDEAATQGPPVPDRLDRLDRAIVSALQLDGRTPYRAIARDLGVSEGTVRLRARRLEREGILRVLGFADPHRLGYGVLASILLTVSLPRHRDVAETLAAWSDVMYLSTCAGRFNLYLQVVCHDHEALYELLTRRLPAIDGVLACETLMELEVHKAKYVYPGLTGDPPATDSP
jgi:Lrp/AsnC family transcriptional regulator for asnA, asnC and gidA